MTRVFICYSRKDTDFADRLTADLKAAGVPTWRDVDDIPGDTAAHTQSWRRAVDAALRECTHMIIIVSPDSMDSIEVEAEWNHFLSLRRPVYPVVYRECDVPYRLHALQLWDVRADYAGVLGRLVGLLPREQPAAQAERVPPEAKITPAPTEVKASASDIQPSHTGKPTWPFVLLTVLGWVVGWAIAAFADPPIGVIIFGAVGGVITGLVLRWAEPAIKWRQIAVMALGWIIGWVSAWVICEAIYELFAWPIGWGIGGAMGGAVTGLILKRAAPAIRRKQVIAVAFGWALGEAIGGTLDVVIGGPFYGPLGLTLGGFIGSSIMYWQLERARRAAETQPRRA